MSDHPHHDDEHERPLSGPALRVKALESLLTEKGLVDPRALDEERYVVGSSERKLANHFCIFWNRC